MARFRATIRGQRGECSRLGTSRSGIRTDTNGWNVGVTVKSSTEDGSGVTVPDTFYVYRTGGSNAQDSVGLIGTVTERLGFEPAKMLKDRILAEALTQAKLRAALDAAKTEHTRYEQANGIDADWQTWYARYMLAYLTQGADRAAWLAAEQGKAPAKEQQQSWASSRYAPPAPQPNAAAEGADWGVAELYEQQDRAK